MYKNTFSTVAESVLIDRETNHVSIINMIDGINAAGFPLILSRIVVMFVLTRQEDDQSSVNATIVITLSGNEIGRQVVNIEFEDKLVNRCIMKVESVVLSNPGVLKFSLFIENTEYGAIELPVNGPVPQPIFAPGPVNA